MTKTTLWTTPGGELSANLAFTNNFAATTNPGVSNDSSQNYSAGSVWINTSTNEAFLCTSSAKGAAVWELTTTGSSTPGQVIAPAASTPTGNGSAALLKGGAGGATSGNGGAATVSGGDATAGNGNGGDLNLQGGAKNGSGVAGVLRIGNGDAVIYNQGAPGTLNATGTLTAALLLAGIVTTTSAAAVAATLDVAANIDTALPSSVAGDSFLFSIINTGLNTLTVGTATGWTLVGTMTVLTNVSARFEARKTATGAWTLYRLS